MSALRSPLFGCGDDDLFTFKVEHGGRWNHQRPLPETLPPDHPVGVAIRVLAGVARRPLWLSPSELLDRIVRERARARGRLRPRPTAVTCGGACGS